MFAVLHMLRISSAEAGSELLSMTARCKFLQFLCQKEIISLMVQGVLYATVKKMLSTPKLLSRLRNISVPLAPLA